MCEATVFEASASRADDLRETKRTSEVRNAGRRRVDAGPGWFALLLTHATVTARIDATLREQHKISFSSVEILCWLLDTEPQSVRALAGKLVSVSPTRASRLVQDLIDAGHLQRDADQGDGRVSLISFTKSGRHFAETIKRTLEGSVKKYFLDPLDEDDIAALTRIWAKLEKQ